MNASTAGPEQGRSATWLPEWEPENEEFWNSRGKAIARRTLIITTANLVLAFVVWFVVSALIVRLEKAGFDLSKGQLYWLVAMPGLAGGTFRLMHMFLVPVFGTRHVVSISTSLLLLPLVGWYFAVQDPDTPYGVLLALAFLAGLGAGNFSSFMPSTSLFYPKRDQGTALGRAGGHRQLRCQPGAVRHALGDRLRDGRKRPGERQGQGDLASERSPDLDARGGAAGDPRRGRACAACPCGPAFATR